MKTFLARNRVDLHQIVRDLGAGSQWCYRGQSNSAWRLVPTLYRDLSLFARPIDEADGEWMGPYERDIYRAFHQKTRRFNHSADQWESIFLARHFGAPTRLLDWTLSIDAAAFFAICSLPNQSASIWCLQHSALPYPSNSPRLQPNGAHRLDALIKYAEDGHVSFFQQYSVPSGAPVPGYKDPILCVVEPPSLMGRFAGQSSLFMIDLTFSDLDFRWDYGGAIEQLQQQLSKEVLVRIDIEADCFEELLRALLREGAGFERLFPEDASGVGSDLALQHRLAVRAELAFQKKKLP